MTDVPVEAFADGSKADGPERAADLVPFVWGKSERAAAGVVPFVWGRPGSGTLDLFGSNTTTPPARLAHYDHLKPRVPAP